MSGNKTKFVIFEGADKVGKTTLFRAYRAATQYGPLAIDRFTGSNYVYDKYYGRESSLDQYLRDEFNIQEIFDCYLILLTSDPDVIEERIKNYESGTAKEVALENFKTVNNLFLGYFTLHTQYKKALIIDTSKCTPEEALNLILEFTGEVNKNE